MQSTQNRAPRAPIYAVPYSPNPSEVVIGVPVRWAQERPSNQVEAVPKSSKQDSCCMTWTCGILCCMWSDPTTDREKLKQLWITNTYWIILLVLLFVGLYLKGIIPWIGIVLAGSLLAGSCFLRSCLYCLKLCREDYRETKSDCSSCGIPLIVIGSVLDIYYPGHYLYVMWIVGTVLTVIGCLQICCRKDSEVSTV